MKTPRLGFAELTALYERQLAKVTSFSQFKQTPITIDAEAIVPGAVRERYASLPSSTRVRDREVEIHYDVEENADGTPLGLAEAQAALAGEYGLPSWNALRRYLEWAVVPRSREDAVGPWLHAIYGHDVENARPALAAAMFVVAPGQMNMLISDPLGDVP